MSVVTRGAIALTTEEAELLTGAVNAIRRGRAEMLLSYVLAGYYCWQFVASQAKRRVSRASATAKLRAGLRAEADTKREGDPNHLIRTYGCLDLLSGGEAEKWARSHGKKDCEAPAFAGALGISKAQALMTLVTQPAGTDEFTWATCDAAEAQAIFQWACGPDAPTTQDIELRVAYHRGPEHGRYLEFSRRRHRCRTAAEFDELIEWAKSLGAEAMLPDERSVLVAAQAAKARVFSPAGGGGPEEDQHPAGGALGAQLGNFPEAGAEELAPALTGAITRHQSPNDVFENLLKLLVASGDLSGKAKRAAAAALVIITRAEKSGTPAPGDKAGRLPLLNGAHAPAAAS